MKWVWGRRYQLPIDARHTHARRHTPGEVRRRKRRWRRRRRRKSSFFLLLLLLRLSLYEEWMAPPTSPPSILNCCCCCWALCVFVDFSHPLVSAPLCHSSRRFAQIESQANEIGRKFQADIESPVIVRRIKIRP